MGLKLWLQRSFTQCPAAPNNSHRNGQGDEGSEGGPEGDEGKEGDEGFEGGIEVLRGNAALWRGLIDIEFACFNCEVFSWHRQTLGDLLENDALVLNHCCCF